MKRLFTALALAITGIAAPGGSAWDHSAMVRALGFMANFQIGQKSA